MGKVVKEIAKAGSDIVKGVTKVVGGALDTVGLDSLGKEVERWGEDVEQVVKVMSGEYHDDMKAIQKQQKQVENQIKTYNTDVDKLADKIDSLIAFHEIFQMAATNRLDKYIGQYGPQIDALIKELNDAIKKLKSEYDFVIGLTEGAFLQKIIGSLIMIVGGIMSDMGDIISGEANSDTWKRVVAAIVTIVVVALLILSGPTGWMLVATVLASIAAFMTLDGMYANGAATGAIMGAFDFLFNDLLNLDDLVGSDFEKFDKDHEDYQQMVMYTKIAMSLASAGISWASNAGNYATAAQHGTQPWSQQTAMLAEQGAGMGAESTAAAFTNKMSDFFGIDTSTFSRIYDAYSAASKVGDVLNEKKAYDALNDKFKETSLKLEDAILSKYSKNFMKHYKDTAYFLQDQQNNIDRYIWSMTSENMYVDPYGTTPVANIRFAPDKDTRMLSFGFEDMFDESRMAGSANYFNNIIYGG